jgi:hypothetical protein
MHAAKRDIVRRCGHISPRIFVDRAGLAVGAPLEIRAARNPHHSGEKEKESRLHTMRQMEPTPSGSQGPPPAGIPREIGAERHSSGTRLARSTKSSAGSPQGGRGGDRQLFRSGKARRVSVAALNNAACLEAARRAFAAANDKHAPACSPSPLSLHSAPKRSTSKRAIALSIERAPIVVILERSEEPLISVFLQQRAV